MSLVLASFIEDLIGREKCVMMRKLYDEAVDLLSVLPLGYVDFRFHGNHIDLTVDLEDYKEQIRDVRILDAVVNEIVYDRRYRTLPILLLFITSDEKEHFDLLKCVDNDRVDDLDVKEGVKKVAKRVINELKIKPSHVCRNKEDHIIRLYYPIDVELDYKAYLLLLIEET